MSTPSDIYLYLEPPTLEIFTNNSRNQFKGGGTFGFGQDMETGRGGADNTVCSGRGAGREGRGGGEIIY